MTRTKTGSNMQEWRLLHMVLSNLDYIIEDGFEVFETPAPTGGWGLMQRALAIAGVPDDTRHVPIYRKSALQSGLPNIFLREIAAALPGLDTVGQTRDERLANLRIRLVELDAYRWFTVQRPFCDALKRAALPAVRNAGPKFGCDVADLKLLKAVVMPLTIFTYGSVARLPRRPVLDKAADSANALVSFLRAHAGLYEVGVDVQHVWHLEQLVVQLRAAYRTKAKKQGRSDHHELQIQFAKGVIKELLQDFGSCPPSVVKELLVFVAYEPDDANLKGWIKDAKSAAATG
jgi:hypothetical protein